VQKAGKHNGGKFIRQSVLSSRSEINITAFGSIFKGLLSHKETAFFSERKGKSSLLAKSFDLHFGRRTKTTLYLQRFSSRPVMHVTFCGLFNNAVSP
jgi:hypothetical protein